MNFILLSVEINNQMAVEVEDNYHKFGEDQVRQYPGSAHIEITDILLRGPDVADLITMHQDIECGDYPNMKLFPEISQYVDKVREKVDAVKVGRVIITRLKSGGRIKEHTDEGPVPEFYQRYHYVIQGGEANLFYIDGDRQVMQTGELWHVNVRKPHHVVNAGGKDRIHLIMDMASEISV